MNTKSKYALRFYLIISAFVILEIFFCVGLCLFSVLGVNLMSLVLIVAIFLLGKWTLQFYKYFPIVTITHTDVFLNYLVGSKRLSIDDICEFQLFDIFPVSLWVNQGDMNGFSIRTKTGEQYIFYEKNYKNPHELRARFAQITNTNFVPRNSAVNNRLISLSRPISLKFGMIIIVVSLISFFVLLLLDLSFESYTIYVLLISSFFIGLALIFESMYHFLTIEVEGVEIRFKRMNGKMITVNLNDIITSNLTILNNRYVYSDIAFSYITPDFRRIVIKGSNLEPEDWNKLVHILEKNGVPVTDITYE